MRLKVKVGYFVGFNFLLVLLLALLVSLLFIKHLMYNLLVWKNGLLLS